ncbi:MAG: thioredoxin family protein [Candidatus Marinimicrobia bacterium]|nr:thioredoxin family protein [Candidatus Neomarinimicrobiota bacterium]MBL7046042.1 thioredoxin family protein [Candidatus Neomarinimicrobiota bacterium]
MSLIRIKKKYIFIFVLVVVGFHSLSLGQVGIAVPEEIVSVKAFLSRNGIHPGESFYLALKCDISDGWHINADVVESEFQIPTEVVFDTIAGISFGEQKFPEAERKKFTFSDDKIPIFSEEITIISSVSLASDFPTGETYVSGKLHYQACNDRMCLPPDDVNWQVGLNIAEEGIEGQGINQKIFSNMASPSYEISGEDSWDIAGWMNRRGLFITFLLVFIGGLALNLTPCVYPLIPITISYFGSQSTGKISKSLLLALFYVFGMALTYSILGTIAATTGSMFGRALQNPVILILIALVLVGLSLSMFGLYEIRVPQSLTKLGGKSRSGIFGSLFMGLTVGIIAAPCIGPFVLSLLIFVGEKGNPFLGFWLFFTLALGLGLPFLILGTFSGMVSSLPQSGTWMVWVRKLFGIILIGMALYFIQTLLSEQVYRILLVLLLIGGGVYLGKLEKSSGGKVFSTVRWSIGGIIFLLGIWFTFPKEQSVGIEWHSFEYSLLEQAKTERKPVFIDFYADWCIPCKELDHKTFSDKMVVDESRRFVSLKMNTTQRSDFVKGVENQFHIRGIPTVLFFNKNGEEIEELRFSGFIGPKEFLAKMKKVD